MPEGPKPTVLLVEDDPITRLASAFDLLDAGISVVEAQDAEEALAVAASDHRLDVVFTDIDLGAGINGVKLVEAIVSIRPEIRVVVTSGYQDFNTLELPSTGRFMAKPYRAGQMIAIIRDQLAI